VRFGDVEHGAAVTARVQHRRGVRALDDLKAIESMAGVDVKRRDALHAHAVRRRHQGLRI
jgi:hypothetical protein